MKMDRTKVRLFKHDIPKNDEYVNLPSNERISFVWDLTEEVFALSGEYDVKSRLQRNVINIIRK
jgi:predicted GIY-YIG superfamily endonuclease